MKTEDSEWMFERFLPGSRNRELIFSDLVRRYSDGRHYHTLEHVLWGLRRIDEIAEAEGVKYVAAIQEAMFFHDAVMHFDEWQFLDEAASAELAAKKTGSTWAYGEPEVVRLILATAHQSAPLRMDEKILVDADLSMLGAAPEHFDNYERLVRLEWAHVPVEEFRKARIEVLRRFEAMPTIFHTDYGRERWEKQARENIARSIATTGERYAR